MIGDTLHEIDGINVFQKPLCAFIQLSLSLFSLFDQFWSIVSFRKARWAE
jgi:hypothetical protein